MWYKNALDFTTGGNFLMIDSDDALYVIEKHFRTCIKNGEEVFSKPKKGEFCKPVLGKLMML